MRTLDFWFEYGSTYSYLAVARIGAAADAAGVTVRWRPFLLMPILVEEGLAQGPFAKSARKTAYMWRDLERRAARHGIAYRRPSRYPPDNVLLTARIGIVAAREGWCRAFTERTFALHWTEDRMIGTEDNIGTVLTSLGREPAAVVAAAQTADNKAALKAQTDEAGALGVFGAPSFVVDGELFWGDDRLEEAIDWARSG